MNEIQIRFKKNLEREYNQHIKSLQYRPADMLIADAEKIAAFKSAYECFQNAEFDVATVEYLMQFQAPLQAISECWYEELFMAANSELFGHAIFDAVDNGRLDDCEPACPPCVEGAVFYTDYSNTFGIDAAFGGLDSGGTACPAIIERVIVLSPYDYADFCESLQRPQSFIAENRELMFVDSKEHRHCLLVCGVGKQNGILVYSDGYDYPCHCACLSDIGHLELDCIELCHGRTGEYVSLEKRTERER